MSPTDVNKQRERGEGVSTQHHGQASWWGPSDHDKIKLFDINKTRCDWTKRNAEYDTYTHNKL